MPYTSLPILSRRHAQKRGLEKKVGTNTIFIVGDKDIAACFDANVSEAAIREISALHPTRAVFRDSSFSGDDVKINAFELFKSIAPDTEVKVI